MKDLIKEFQRKLNYTLKLMNSNFQVYRDCKAKSTSLDRQIRGEVKTSNSYRLNLQSAITAGGRCANIQTNILGPPQ